MATQKKSTPEPVQHIRVDHGINRSTGQVVTMFSAHVNNLTCTPAQAVETAVKMLECAQFLEPSSVKDISWPGKGEATHPGASVKSS